MKKSNLCNQDLKLTEFRRNLEGYGSIDDLKMIYSYDNENDMNDIFEIIESIIFFSLVSQKMNSYDNVVDVELDSKIEKLKDFIKSNGLSFYDGELHLENTITKDFIIKKFVDIF